MKSLAIALVLTTTTLSAADIRKVAIKSRGGERAYHLFVPASEATTPRPLLVTLHGSGRDGASLVSKWQQLATANGIIVAGPDALNAQEWSAPEDGPQFLHDVVEDIRKKHNVDARRVYLFGHSGGAIFALQMALMESEYFAAAAVHAGALTPDSYFVTKYAARKIPVSLVVGSRDKFFPVEAVRATQEELLNKGFAAEFSEIKNHTHDYYGRAESINKDAWTFLSRHALAVDAKYKPYGDPQ